jgi:hypothetical protein
MGRLNVATAELESIDTANGEVPPVCLCPWLENPYRLVSLWDMLQVSADRYVEFGRAIQGWIYGPELIVAPRQRLDEKTLDRFRDMMITLQQHCEDLNLGVTGELISGIANDLPNVQITREIAGARLGEIHRCFISELKSKVFFHMPAEKAKYYSDLLVEVPKPFQRPKLPAPPFGIEAAKAFPSIVYDSKEAGNCLALGRNTACVFHLMRVLEIGLTALGAVFAVSLARTNWAPAIDQIESHVRDMHKDPVWKAMADCKEQQEFYSQVASHFVILKDAWRNYTVHARGKYDDEEAESIFRSARAFMEKLATRLHE